MMIVPDPLPLFTRMTRLGALAAVAAVTVWWVRKHQKGGARAGRRPGTASAVTGGTLKRVDAKPTAGAAGRTVRGETRRPAKVAVRA